MPELKDYDELEIGDQFLTEDWNGKPVKLTVERKDGGEVLCLENGLDIDLLDGYYVVGKKTEDVKDNIQVVTLCGSSKFKVEFDKANEKLTLAGYIVISMGVFGHLMSDEERAINFTDEVKDKLDILHYRKIDRSDSIYVINLNGYIGSSTRKEIEYARSKGKQIGYLEPPK